MHVRHTGTPKPQSFGYLGVVNDEVRLMGFQIGDRVKVRASTGRQYDRWVQGIVVGIRKSIIGKELRFMVRLDGEKWAFPIKEENIKKEAPEGAS